MAKTRVPEEKIREILAEQDRGVPVAELIKTHKISSATFYNWKSKYGENKASDGPRRGRPKGSRNAAPAAARGAAPAPAAIAGGASGLAEENNRLKVMLVDLMLEIDSLKKQLAKR
jgi:transposase-like protein